MEIKERLKQLALNKTILFCYSCYKEARSGLCSTCGSDDLAMLLPETGVNYGIEWTFECILNENLTPVDIDSAHEDFVSEIYSETVKIGWIECDVASAIKELDPISWEISKSEYIDFLTEDDQIMTFDNRSKYYWRHDIESFLDANGV